MADSKKIHLWPEELKEQEGQIISSFILEIPNNERKQIWYRLPIEFAPAITRCCDPFVLAALFISMSTPADLIVHGEVSPSLLFKLKEFQAAWSSWLPDRYTSIDIISDSEQEQSKHDSSNALMTFSGGVDSCFTAWRYNKPGCETFPYHLKTCLVVHGFDFPPQHEGTFSQVLRRSRSILDSVGMTLIPITTNLRTINQIVDYTHGAFLASRSAAWIL